MSSSQATSAGCDDILDGSFIREMFYCKAIDEINSAYRYKLFPCVNATLRKILENLLIDILRFKYGTARIHLYYDNGRFNDFSILIRNFRDNLIDFKHYSSALNSRLFTKLEQFRDKGNAAAHHIDAFIDRPTVDSSKEDMNYLVNLLWEIREKVRIDAQRQI